MRPLFVKDDIRNLRQEGRYHHTQRDAHACQQRAQQHHLRGAAVVHSPHGDEEGGGEGEAEGGGEAGPALVGPVADEWGDEGGEDEGEEDEAAAGGGVVEEAVDVQGEDGVPGCEEGGLDEGAEEGGEEAPGGEEGEDWVDEPFWWGGGGGDGEGRGAVGC